MKFKIILLIGLIGTIALLHSNELDRAKTDLKDLNAIGLNDSRRAVELKQRIHALENRSGINLNRAASKADIYKAELAIQEKHLEMLKALDRDSSATAKAIKKRIGALKGLIG